MCTVCMGCDCVRGLCVYTETLQTPVVSSLVNMAHLGVKGHQACSWLNKHWESGRQISWLFLQMEWLLTAAHSLSVITHTVQLMLHMSASYSQSNMRETRPGPPPCMLLDEVSSIQRNIETGSGGACLSTQMESQNDPSDKFNARASETPQEPFYSPPFLQVLTRMITKEPN